MDDSLENNSDLLLGAGKFLTANKDIINILRFKRINKLQTLVILHLKILDLMKEESTITGIPPHDFKEVIEEKDKQMEIYKEVEEKNRLFIEENSTLNNTAKEILRNDKLLSLQTSRAILNTRFNLKYSPKLNQCQTNKLNRVINFGITKKSQSVDSLVPSPDPDSNRLKKLVNFKLSIFQSLDKGKTLEKISNVEEIISQSNDEKDTKCYKENRVKNPSRCKELILEINNMNNIMEANLLFSQNKKFSRETRRKYKQIVNQNKIKLADLKMELEQMSSQVSDERSFDEDNILHYSVIDSESNSSVVISRDSISINSSCSDVFQLSKNNHPNFNHQNSYSSLFLTDQFEQSSSIDQSFRDKIILPRPKLRSRNPKCVFKSIEDLPNQSPCEFFSKKDSTRSFTTSVSSPISSNYRTILISSDNDEDDQILETSFEERFLRPKNYNQYGEEFFVTEF